MKNFLAALSIILLTAFCGGAHAQNAQIQPFQLSGNTITFTAAVTCPTPVQATTAPNTTVQYVVTNTGAVAAFISFGTAAQATANCVIPTATAQAVYVILPLTQITITAYANSFFTGITGSSTAVIYVSPGVGS